MLLKGILIVIMSALSEVVVNQSKDFCQAFADNGFEIDYGYEQRNYTPYGRDFFLFIDHNYWPLQWDNRLEFKSTQSQRIQWFGNQYKIAIQQWFCVGKQLSCDFRTGLLNKQKNTIIWAPIKYDSKSGSLIKSDDYKNYLFNTSEIVFDSDFEASVGNRNLFLHQKTYNSFPVKYYRTYRSFEFDGETGKAVNITERLINLLKSSMNMEDIDYGSDETIANNLIDIRTESLKIIAMFEDESGPSFYLFKEDKAITYCVFNGFLKCSRDRVLLINCSHIQQTLIKSKTQSLTKSSIKSLIQSSTHLPTTVRLLSKTASNSSQSETPTVQEMPQIFQNSNNSLNKTSERINNQNKPVIVLTTKKAQPKNSPLFWFIVSFITSFVVIALICGLIFWFISRKSHSSKGPKGNKHQNKPQINPQKKAKNLPKKK